MADPIEMVTKVAEATADISKEITQRDAEKNAADMKAAAAAASEQQQVDAANAEVAAGDVEKERKDYAE